MALVNRDGMWYMRFQFGGRYVHRSTGLKATVRNRKEAEAHESRERKRMAALSGLQAEPKGFGEAADEFLGWVKLHRAANTYTGYKSLLRAPQKFFAQRSIAAIRPGDLEAFKVWHANPTAVRGNLVVMSALFCYAKRNGWCEANPVRGLHPQRTADRPQLTARTLSYAEEERYFKAASHPRRPPHCAAIARLMLLQGLTLEEAYGIRKADVDLIGGKLFAGFVALPENPGSQVPPVGTGQNKRPLRRTIDLIEESQELLAEWMQGDSPWVFPATADPTKHARNMNSPHSTIVAAAGLSDFTLSSFRHTFAARMVDIGVDLGTLAAILGLRDIRAIFKVTAATEVTAEYKKAALQQYQDARRGMVTKSSSLQR